MKIYTKTGDKGKTSLFDGTRVRKDNIRVETYGTVDELNSLLGVVSAECQISNVKYQISNKEEQAKNHNKVIIELQKIQNNLFDIGAILANPNIDLEKQKRDQVYFEKRITALEKFIDEMTRDLPERNNFILPGGGKAGALLHVARTVCRRTERRVIALSKEIEVQKEIIMYFNRLSDLLFTMSRWVNWIEGEKETVWKKNI